VPAFLPLLSLPDHFGTQARLSLSLKKEGPVGLQEVCIGCKKSALAGPHSRQSGRALDQTKKKVNKKKARNRRTEIRYKAYATS